MAPRSDTSCAAASGCAAKNSRTSLLALEPSEPSAPVRAERPLLTRSRAASNSIPSLSASERAESSSLNSSGGFPPDTSLIQFSKSASRSLALSSLARTRS